MSVGSTQLRRFTWSLVRPNTAPSPTQWRCSFERDVPAEQEEGAVRHVDDAHQAEDQGEAARDDEVEPGRGDAVQGGDEEVLGVVDRGAERRSPGEKQHPDDHEQDEHEGQSEPPVAQAAHERARAHAGTPTTASALRFGRLPELTCAAN